MAVEACFRKSALHELALGIPVQRQFPAFPRFVTARSWKITSQIHKHYIAELCRGELLLAYCKVGSYRRAAEYLSAVILDYTLNTGTSVRKPGVGEQVCSGAAVVLLVIDK